MSEAGTDGRLVGFSLGLTDTLKVGQLDGCRDEGTSDFSYEGHADGVPDGIKEGQPEGGRVGERVTR